MIKHGLLTRRGFVLLAGAAACERCFPASGPQPSTVQPQPYFAGVKRAIETLSNLGEPLADADARRIAALARQNDFAAVPAAERILERYTLARLSINVAGNSLIRAGGAPKELIEQGWRVFLIGIRNPGGIRGQLHVLVHGKSGLSGVDATMNPGSMSGDPGAVMTLAQRGYLADTVNKAPLLAGMWVLSELDDFSLSGIPIEYRTVALFSRDRGQRVAELAFMVFPESDARVLSADREFAYGRVWGRGQLDFVCQPSRDVTLGILDTDGEGCVASLVIRDALQRIYPPQAMRVAPDLPFQQQIYRADGETVRLPDGEYTIVARRGPEYLPVTTKSNVAQTSRRIEVKLVRWIDPTHWGWYSGDTHIHAAGCAHYSNPTEGVAPETMIRQVRGEGLSIGEILTWGPGWYYQKKFFTGHAISPQATLEHPELQTANAVSWKPRPTAEDSESSLRYDLEISGFPSSHAGHLVLLRLKEQDYPGTRLVEDWPSWNLPILKWAKAQGAVVGYGHCGHGMAVNSNQLPNYEVPPMDGVGANEAIVDVTHGDVDFLSGCDLQPVAELNTWYHLLNCGYKMAMFGETDYPCINSERPGVGRTYVQLDRRPVGEGGYEDWIRGSQAGSLYCGDGRSHFLNIKINGGSNTTRTLLLRTGGPMNIQALVAARLEPRPPADLQAIRDYKSWHIELARIGKTRNVGVELVVNGSVVATELLRADGTPHSVSFQTSIERSSWIALRVLPSAHTHPIFVEVANQPIRASRRSAQWCIACVDRLWAIKSGFIRQSERTAAAEAFEHARKTYGTISADSDVS